MRNDLKAALDKIDQQYLNELVGGQEPGEEDTQNDLKVHEENTTIEELEVISIPTLFYPPSHLSFPRADRQLSSLDCQLRAHCHLWSLQRPFFYFMFLFTYSCCSYFPSLHSHSLLPAFKNNHSSMFTVYLFIRWSFKTSSVYMFVIIHN